MDHELQLWTYIASAILLFPLFLYILWEALVTLWWRPRRIRKMFEGQGIPCLPYHFYHGNLPEFVAINQDARRKMPSHLIISHDIAPLIMPQYYQWSKTFGENFVYWMGSQARFTITEPAHARQILSDSERYQKPYRRPDSRDVLANGLTTLNGADWQRHRRITNPAFLAKYLKAMIPRMASCMIEMIEKWGSSSEVDVHKEFINLTASVIARTAFGSTSVVGMQVAELQHKQILNLQKALRSVYIPGMRFLPTPFNLHRWKINNDLNKIIQEVVESRLKLGKSSEILDENDLLGMMIAATMGELQGNQRNLRMGMDEVISECRTFFFTGHETTAALLTWTCFLLAMNPQWQERIREEVQRVCGITDILTAESVNKLKVVNMVLNESLRLYPPAVSLFRTTTTDTQIGKLIVPAGTELVVPVIAWHHDEKYWGPDVHEFKPERHDARNFEAYKKEAFLPFSIGPRNCIGQTFAMLEAKVAISIILQNFRLSLSSSYRHTPINILMLHPEFGMPLLLEKL